MPKRNDEFFSYQGMALEVQVQGLDWGYHLNYDGYTQSSQEVWPHLPEILHVLDVTFGCFFAAEVVLRLLGFANFWCFLDVWP